jgi:hypothetical protein
MKDFFKGTTHSEEKDNNPKHHKYLENNHQGNSFIRINSTKKYQHINQQYRWNGNQNK